MIKKRLIFLIILCLFSISAVSANEIVNETNYVSIYDNAVINEDYGDFYELADLIDKSKSGSSIELNKSYKNTDNYSSEGIKINIDNLTINGNGHIIDANKIGRVFQISSSNVLINNITFINGRFLGDGGSIYWAGENGTLLKSSFINNVAINGSSVYWAGINGNITNSSFINGNGIPGKSLGCSAIYWIGNNGFVNDSIFLNNKSEWQNYLISCFDVLLNIIPYF